MEKNKGYTKELVEDVEKFFKLRFPDKDIKFEKKCGYFWEWCGRLYRGSHIDCSDTESRKAWESIL